MLPALRHAARSKPLKRVTRTTYRHKKSWPKPGCSAAAAPPWRRGARRAAARTALRWATTRRTRWCSTAAAKRRRASAPSPGWRSSRLASSRCRSWTRTTARCVPNPRAAALPAAGVLLARAALGLGAAASAAAAATAACAHARGSLPARCVAAELARHRAVVCGRARGRNGAGDAQCKG